MVSPDSRILNDDEIYDFIIWCCEKHCPVVKRLPTPKMNNSLNKWPGDPEVKAALDWFLQFIDSSLWEKKKKEVADHIKNVLATKEKSVPLFLDSTRVIYPYDKFGWYLYLADSYTSHIEDYEFSQGARIIPIFKIIGKHLDLINNASGVEAVIKRLFELEKDNPDGAIFELIVSLLYLRNGWKKVELITESPPGKTADIHVESKLEEYFIECKRLSKSSEYSERERLCWLKMSHPLLQYLASRGRPLIIDITFHVELCSMDSDYVLKELIPKLDFVWNPGVVIENHIWRVKIDSIDFDRIIKHMETNDIKIPSSALINLIFKEDKPGRGYTPIVLGKMSPISNTYLDSIDFAAGAVWSCDAEASIQRKSRDILRHLSEACSQLPDKFPGIVHIGLESHDGAIVEDERFKKIVTKGLLFDSKGKDLRWIYCHIFDPRVPPDGNWDFGETVIYFSSDKAGKEPLVHRQVVLPFDAKTYNGVFWR